MRKTFLTMMLLAGISNRNYAQSAADINSLFEVQPNAYHRIFFFNLGKGDKMQLEVFTPDDLPFIPNIDSVIDVFIKELEPLKDSLSPDVNTRCIEYTIDAANLKRLSITRHTAPVSNFVISNGDISLLKLSQDTLVITAVVPDRITHGILQKETIIHYYRISFFLNDLNDLGRYKDHLAEKIEILSKSVKTNWKLGSNALYHLKDHPFIEAPTKRGYNGGGNFISVKPSVDIQNYRNYFVPSVSGGLAVVTNQNLLHREYFIGYERHFLFKKDSAGKQNIYCNNFLVISLGQGRINPFTKKTSSLYPFVSIGYLLQNRGGFFDKNTWKIGLARFNLFGNHTKIEPTFYFSNFFRKPSPSLRLTQSF